MKQTKKTEKISPAASGRVKPSASLPKARLADPQLARELEKYGDHPLPSREFILESLEQVGVPMYFDDLCQQLAISPEEHAVFTRRLDAMVREGQLLINRRGAICVAEKLNLIKGRVQGHPDGFGFLIPEDGTGDLFLSAKEMDKVMHGDTVLARAMPGERRGKREGTVVEVITRAQLRVVGRVLVEHGVWLLAPSDKRIAHDIVLAPDGHGVAAPGDVVVVELVTQPSRHVLPMGKVVEVLGSATDPGIEIEIALRKHALPHTFSEEVEEEARHTPQTVRKSDWSADRQDLRALPLVTIDGETARDFDDAVYAEPQGQGWRLVVAIADVSHYVRPGDALDTSALERGTSVYFPRRVIPMLPEALSNGICSLNPAVERCCMVCDMVIDATGSVKKYQFYPAVMRSHARLTYTQVAAWLENPEQMAPEQAHLLPHVRHLHGLFQVLLEARQKRGAIEFDTVETQMIFNESGKIDRIVPVVRNDAHRLIEECMLSANVCASDFLQKHKQACLFRIHEGPTQEKLEKLRVFLREFGLDLGGGDDPHGLDYSSLMKRISRRPDAGLLQTVLLKSMQQAVYSPDNVGHFGLAYEGYTHFTSPIRRYPDLLVHRSIRAVLSGKPYKPGDWAQLGEHCSMTERRADDASREVEWWLKCFYIRDHVGEEFDGVVSNVTAFGLFVTLDNLFIDGLVHISDLGSDYYHHDPARHLLQGERTGNTYRLADRVRVRVVRADLETSKIDFVLAQGSDTAGSGSSRAAADGRPGGKGAHNAGSKAASQPDAKAGAKTGAKGVAKTGAKTDSKPDAKSGSKPGTKRGTPSAGGSTGSERDGSPRGRRRRSS